MNDSQPLKFSIDDEIALPVAETRLPITASDWDNCKDLVEDISETPATIQSLRDVGITAAITIAISLILESQPFSTRHIVLSVLGAISLGGGTVAGLWGRDRSKLIKDSKGRAIKEMERVKSKFRNRGIDSDEAEADDSESNYEFPEIDKLPPGIGSIFGAIEDT